MLNLMLILAFILPWKVHRLLCMHKTILMSLHLLHLVLIKISSPKYYWSAESMRAKAEQKIFPPKTIKPLHFRAWEWSNLAWNASVFKSVHVHHLWHLKHACWNWCMQAFAQWLVNMIWNISHTELVQGCSSALHLKSGTLNKIVGMCICMLLLM